MLEKASARPGDRAQLRITCGRTLPLDGGRLGPVSAPMVQHEDFANPEEQRLKAADLVKRERAGGEKDDENPGSATCRSRAVRLGDDASRHTRHSPRGTV